MITQRLRELSARFRLPLWSIHSHVPSRVPCRCGVPHRLRLLPESRYTHVITGTYGKLEQPPQTGQADTTKLSAVGNHPIPLFVRDDDGTTLYALVVAAELTTMPDAAMVEQALEVREVGSCTVRACELGYLGRICVRVAEEEQLLHGLHWSSIPGPRGSATRWISRICGCLT